MKKLRLAARIVAAAKRLSDRLSVEFPSPVYEKIVRVIETQVRRVE